MSVVQQKSYKENDEKEMNANNYLEVIFMILNRIMDYTKDLDEKTPSIFDHYCHSQDSDKASISTSSSDSSSGDFDLCCEIDKLDIEDFIINYYKKMDFNSYLLILAMMNLDKLLSKNFILTDTNIHKVFFICMMETQKYYEDENFTNKDYAKICGITTDELLELELEFLNYLDFNIFIKDEEYFKYKDNLKNLYESSVIINNTYIQNDDDES